MLNARMRSRKICKYLFTVYRISTVDRIDIEETVCAVVFGEMFWHEGGVCTHISFISERFHFYGLMIIPNLCVFFIERNVYAIILLSILRYAKFSAALRPLLIF